MLLADITSDLINGNSHRKMVVRTRINYHSITTNEKTNQIKYQLL